MRTRIGLTLAAALLVASRWMPWATWHALPSTGTTVERAGALGWMLVAFGMMVVAVAWWPSISRHRWRIVAALGAAAATVSLAAALTAMSSANDLTGIGGSATAYSWGAGVALAVSILIVLVGTARLARLSLSPTR